MHFQRVYVVINPTAGGQEPVLSTLNAVFRNYKIEWQVGITHAEGDGTRLAQAAADAGYDVVAAYGGDGTVMEVANGLLGSGIPLAILPGGTGNAMAAELKIPRELEAAAGLLCNTPRLRRLDVGRIGDRYFLLRAYVGKALQEIATREDKTRLGVWAYVSRAIQTIANPQQAQYHVTIDGGAVELEGLTCVITNSGSVGGLPNWSFQPGIRPDDGLLDVFILNNDMASIISMASSLLDLQPLQESLRIWQGREITIETDDPQTIWMDGEPVGETPFTAVNVPQAIPVVVPPDSPSKRPK